MKVIIAGGRDFDDYTLMERRCDDFFWNSVIETDIEIVSGGQVTTDKDTGEKYGADYLGEQYAINNGYHIKRFHANWGLYGKQAGYKRNAEMGNYANALIAFWDGKSKGTKMMIDLAAKKGLIVNIVRY